MKNILIFAGTTEGRQLSECLIKAGIAHTICVATEYGKLVLKQHPIVKIHRGRMQQEDMEELITKGKFTVVIDATHPYADLVTAHMIAAVNRLNSTAGTNIVYLRLQRECAAQKGSGKVEYFDTNESCAKALEKTKGNILLTIGSKELSKYCVNASVKERLYVRVLPSAESLSLCMQQGICGQQIIAMQGPFQAQMNEAMIRQYEITCMVTKESGEAGGYQEKLEAAERAGIITYVVGPPRKKEGYCYPELCRELEKLCGQAIGRDNGLHIMLAGVGMGHENLLTKEVMEAIEDADILLGAQRVIEPYQAKIEKQPFYQAGQIIPYLQKLTDQKVVILFSGDTGFYSGCKTLYQALQEEVGRGSLKASICMMPGITSVAYLAARIGESYQDAAVISMHGKEIRNLARRIQGEEKTYILMSGVLDIKRLGTLLVEAGMENCEVVAGYQLSYEQERILKLSAQECCEQEREGLYVCLVKNPVVKIKRLTHGMADREFIRESVPMTKEEIREVGICKLKLHKRAVVYDIGSGTGSVAVEIAGLSDDIQVCAVEHKKEAVTLIEQNRKKFGLENISIVEAKAPEGLDGLPVATHAFIGGSGGRLQDILSTLYKINSDMRVVIHAVSIETICEIRKILTGYPVKNEEMVQIQVNRAKRAGQHHLMQAENPVWIAAFDFAGLPMQGGKA